MPCVAKGLFETLLSSGGTGFYTNFKVLEKNKMYARLDLKKIKDNILYE